ncbi:thiamine phosphate synthase [Perlabentimonas gracilis]|uniref:thiamine phosphate synthase n=1 Tax=Perlabentimonas gracilis TaxID=2715279 RepID=UPI001407C3FA|nr:thiamine phosphate synthase [Perlabentimonas gracilis]NHB67165.1 thiamine phosphate synthase [Perlabentimonas gracilis]
MNNISKLHFITNQWSQTPIFNQVERYIKGGGNWVQLRLKGFTKDEMIEVGRPISSLCRESNVRFIVNDCVEVAAELNACGVHLGREDMLPVEVRRILGPHKIIGATANNLAELEHAIAQPINYVGYGPYRFTKTKEKLSAPIGIDGYREAVSFMGSKDCHIPIIAIGGIEVNDIESILGIGVYGVALSGNICNSENIIEATEKLLQTIQNIQ